MNSEMRIPIKVFLATVVTFILFSNLLSGQGTVISSEASYIIIKNNTTVIPEDDMTTPLPFIIVYPKFTNTKKRTFITEANQINIIGKLNNTENTTQVFINNSEVDFSSEGLFFKIIDLFPGKNILNIKVIPKAGKIIIVRFIVDYKGEGT